MVKVSWVQPIRRCEEEGVREANLKKRKEWNEMKSRWECCVGVTQVIHFYLSFTSRRQTRLNTSADLRQQEGETNTS